MNESPLQPTFERVKLDQLFEIRRLAQRLNSDYPCQIHYLMLGLVAGFAVGFSASHFGGWADHSSIPAGLLAFIVSYLGAQLGWPHPKDGHSRLDALLTAYQPVDAPLLGALLLKTKTKGFSLDDVLEWTCSEAESIRHLSCCAAAEQMSFTQRTDLPVPEAITTVGASS